MPEINEWNVLLADDEPDSLSLIHDILSLHGARVYQASNGAQFRALFKSMSPTIVVVDLSMPKPDGWDLLAEIRGAAHNSRVPVVAVSAYYSEKVIQEAERAGFNAFLPKPIRSSSLLNTLVDVVGGRRVPMPST